jgi:hypothetical protein
VLLLQVVSACGGAAPGRNPTATPRPESSPLLEERDAIDKVKVFIREYRDGHVQAPRGLYYGKR